MNNDNKDDFIDTTEAGGGSYPEPLEQEEKCYQFDFKASTNGYGIVYAKNEDDAKNLILNNEYEDIIETYDLKIEEITKIEEN